MSVPAWLILAFAATLADPRGRHHFEPPAEPEAPACVIERAGLRLELSVGVQPPSPDSLADALAARISALAARLELAAITPPLRVRYFPTPVAKARAVGTMVLEDCGLSGDAGYRVWNPADPLGDGLPEAALLLRRALGPTECDWLAAGAQVWLAGQWLGVPLAEWPARLAALDPSLTASSINRGAGFRDNSAFFTWPLAGCMVAQYVRVKGMGGLRTLFRNSANSPGDWPERVDAEVGLPPVSKGSRDLRGIPRRPGLQPLPVTVAAAANGFERGICYAHDYSLEAGYASEASAENLRYLRDRLHVNAIALSPFGYIRGATELLVHCSYRMRGAGRAGEENDESLLAATEMAHALGQSVMMAPHLWGRVWCGDWHATDEAGWTVLFDEYRRFILHYAALAEYAGCDALQIGKELGGTTHREADWRNLVTAIRRVYHGPLLYGANWNKEYRRIAWWDAIELIGVSEYTPLSDRDNPTDAELIAGARAVADSLDIVAKRFDRRYVLTEVGFTAEAGTARNPWIESEGRVADPELQARCYDAILATFSARPQCAGLFWWKWFSHLESNNRGGNVHDFPPYGKPAEAVLARWYGKLATARE